jgi:hypothetical protein
MGDMGILGDMEILIVGYWNDGILEYWEYHYSIIPPFHHSFISLSPLSPYPLFYTFS